MSAIRALKAGILKILILYVILPVNMIDRQLYLSVAVTKYCILGRTRI